MVVKISLSYEPRHSTRQSMVSTNISNPKRQRRSALREKHWPSHQALTAEVQLQVPFQDADPTGVAWHGNYFRYYDAARVALLARLQFGYREMAELGQMWPIVDTRVRYLHSAPFDAPLRVTAQLVEWEFRLRIYYQIFHVTGTASEIFINEAYTLQVPVDAATERLIVGSPTDLIQRIEKLIDLGSIE